MMSCPHCGADLRKILPSGKAPSPPEEVEYWCGSCLRAFDEDLHPVGQLQKGHT